MEDPIPPKCVSSKIEAKLRTKISLKYFSFCIEEILYVLSESFLQYIKNYFVTSQYPILLTIFHSTLTCGDLAHFSSSFWREASQKLLIKQLFSVTSILLQTEIPLLYYD